MLALSPELAFVVLFVLYVLTVKLGQALLDLRAQRRACPHNDTTLSVTADHSVRVDCNDCGEYVGSWLRVTESAQR